jgi:predicted RNA-binding Zn-ribbon protein involved in translation (DUF1610 family)
MGKRNKKKFARSVALRVFRCPNCSLILKAPKDRDTGAQHIKDMWCTTCREIVKFEQIDSDRIFP